jgi:hypothetical protein
MSPDSHSNPYWATSITALPVTETGKYSQFWFPSQGLWCWGQVRSVPLRGGSTEPTFQSTTPLPVSDVFPLDQALKDKERKRLGPNSPSSPFPFLLLIFFSFLSFFFLFLFFFLRYWGLNSEPTPCPQPLGQPNTEEGHGPRPLPGEGDYRTSAQSLCFPEILNTPVFDSPESQ